MSIKIMTKVWEESAHKGNALLLLLALADHANDDHVCWPSETTLAIKTRVTKRYIVTLLDELEASGEVYAVKNVGRGNTNLYLITLGLAPADITRILERHFGLSHEAAERATDAIVAKRKGVLQFTFLTGEKVNCGAEKGELENEKVNPSSRKGEPQFTQNHHEPSTESSEKSSESGATAPTPALSLVSAHSEPENGNGEHRGKKSKEPKVPIPLAVQVYRDMARLFPDRVLWPKISEAIGTEQAALDRWREVVTAWIGCGWNKRNVTGMLDFYRRGQLPSTGNGGNRGNTRASSGTNRAPSEPVELATGLGDVLYHPTG